MLTEYLGKSKFLPDDALQNSILGVQACRFSLYHPEANCAVGSAAKTNTPSLEAVFCCKGTLLLEWSDHRQRVLHAREILLLSAQNPPCHIHSTQPLEGIVLCIDTAQLQQSLQSVSFHMENHRLHMQQIQEYMQKQNGCTIIRHTPWSNAVFSTLYELPQTEWAHYCIWKIIELLYLLCTNHKLSIQKTNKTMSNSRFASTISAIYAYMETHMDEKLTIASLSHQFCLSPTTLKNCFRHMYGRSVHNCLQHMRIAKAAKLLSTSNMTVLQIAQSVGYEGVSQFNAVFKKTYGLTPTQYRKMSISVDSCPNSQDN